MLGDPPDYEPPAERSIAGLAGSGDPRATLLDAMLADGGRGLIYFPLLGYADGDFEMLRTVLEHPLSMLSLSDGGAHCGLICDASSPTYMLTYWARDRQRGPQLALEHAVRLQTRGTAEAYGLNDRGLVQAGCKADLNLIDFDALHLHAPVMVRDLPAGGRRLVQHADGYVATLVAGETTWERGEATGAMPGRLLRGPQAA